MFIEFLDLKNIGFDTNNKNYSEKEITWESTFIYMLCYAFKKQYNNYNNVRFAQETPYFIYINFIILSKPIVIINKCHMGLHSKRNWTEILYTYNIA